MPSAPHFKDYVAALIDDFVPLAGDRAFGEDAAIVGGIGRLKGRSVMVIGHEKGSDTTSRVRHNFGMGRPEGYRKAVRLMLLAQRFRLPVVTLVDTPGAFPGIDAEERGQAEAIARATAACLDLDVPVVAAIVGEGGSGGAVALATANRIVMFEHAIYAVISPEGCASILWRGDNRAPDGTPAAAGPNRAARSRRGDEGDRERPQKARRRRPHRLRAARRGAPRSRDRDRAPRHRDRRRADRTRRAGAGGVAERTAGEIPRDGPRRLGWTTAPRRRCRSASRS